MLVSGDAEAIRAAALRALREDLVEAELNALAGMGGSSIDALKRQIAHVEKMAFLEYLSGKQEFSFPLKRIEIHPVIADQLGQIAGNNLLHGLADLSGDPKLKKLADEGGVAWESDREISGEGIESVEHKEITWERRMIGVDPGTGSQSFEITGKVENGAFLTMSVKEIVPPAPTEERRTLNFETVSSPKMASPAVWPTIFPLPPEVELDTSGRPGTLDELKETEGYTRNCRSCGAAMKVQAWSSSDGGHEDSKYVCPKGHVEWVDGCDS